MPPTDRPQIIAAFAEFTVIQLLLQLYDAVKVHPKSDNSMPFANKSFDKPPFRVTIEILQ